MRRTSINPSQWGLAYHMDQGEVVEGATRHLRCSGQADLHDDPGSELGVRVGNPNDLPRQLEAALAGIDQILEGAGMTRANVVGLRIYTTDVDLYLEHERIFAKWIAAAGIRPPQSLLGVARLALPGMMIEIEAEAAA